MAIRFCPHCEISLRAEARFCGHCGRPAPRRLDVDVVRDEIRRDRRHLRAVVTVFVGTLLALWLAGLPFDEAEESAGQALTSFALQLAVGVLACVVVGGPQQFAATLRASLAGRPDLRSMALAVPVGVASYLAGVAWIGLLIAAVGAEPGETDALPLWMILAVVVGAPLVEEWIDRGVLWHIATPLAGERGAVWITATLFALMHGLNGGFVLELPHRFVAGLLFGWLRLRSGSLLPSIAAHMLVNGLAVGFG